MHRALRREYLEAMGLETWVVRAPVSSVSAAAPDPVELPRGTLSGAGRPATAESAETPRTAALGVAAQARPLAGKPTTAPITAANIVPQDAHREAAYDWTQLRERVAACTRCGLSATRTQTVFGVGNPTAEWLVVGEAPGAEEDKQGEPFVGRAGQLLNSMLRAIGLAREQVYIANALKCRPPHNRDPLPGEIAECLPYLERQIALLRPKIMLVVGRIAAQNLLRTDVPLGRLRQQVHVFGASRVPLVVTYHPAYLLRAPAEKRKTWEDLKFAREVAARG
jgi:uracil-DNA glycosylase